MNLAALRRQIDALDRQLVRLLGQRARRSLAIARLKRAAGLRLFHHAREKQIAENVARANRGPLPDRCVQHIWVQILQQTRKAVRATLRAEARRAARPARGGKRKRAGRRR